MFYELNTGSAPFKGDCCY